MIVDNSGRLFEDRRKKNKKVKKDRRKPEGNAKQEKKKN